MNICLVIKTTDNIIKSIYDFSLSLTSSAAGTLIVGVRVRVRVDTRLVANAVVMATAAVTGGAGVELKIRLRRTGNMDRPLPSLRGGGRQDNCHRHLQKRCWIEQDHNIETS